MARYVSRRCFSSALYITKDKAQKHYVLLTPVIEFEKQLQDKENLVRNISLRGLDIDVDKLEQHWRFFQFIDQRKETLEHTRNEIGLKIRDLMQNAEENKDDIEVLKLHSKLVKNDLRNVKDHYYGVEEATMLKILDLPNALHEKTPSHNEQVVYEFSNKPDKSTHSHIQIGKAKGLIKYLNSFTCYLTSDAALFELSISNYFRKCMIDAGYLQFSNSNFCRSIIIEGCGDNLSETLTLENVHSHDDLNHLHLCGSSSLSSFMTYFSRHQVQSSLLPLRCFSLGKQYHICKDPTMESLLHLNQQSVVNFFIADTKDRFEILVDEIKEVYQRLGYHFRLVLLPANCLKKSESLRLAVQMYSSYLESYVEVGNISFYEDYLSKRLLFTYTDEDKERKYLRVMSGAVVNIPKLLACVLESTKGDLLTDVLKQHLFI